MFQGPSDPSSPGPMPGEWADPAFQPYPLESAIPIPDPALEASTGATEPIAESDGHDARSIGSRALLDLEEDSTEGALPALEPTRLQVNQQIEEDTEHSDANVLFAREELDVPEPPKHEPFIDRGWFEDLKGLNRQIKPSESAPMQESFPVGVPFEGRRMHVPRFSERIRIPSFARALTYRCHQCGGEIKDNRCQSCGQKFCPVCGLALEDGRCPDRSCISHRAAVCSGCGERECCCES